MKLDVLSVSQAETFDPEQLGGCPRRWYFERVEGHRPEPSAAKEDGEAGHGLLAHYLRTGEEPQGRVRMGKAVRAAVARGLLPRPSPWLLVESRFDGQPQRDAQGQWIPLDRAKTLHLGGVAWDGFVDVRWRGNGEIIVMDHKFSSDPRATAKPADKLIRTVQLPVYALDSMRMWPERYIVLAHHYISRRGEESFLRRQVVTREQVLERTREIERLVQEMQAVAKATRQDDVPYNRKSCSAWTGCPHQSRCKAFKEKSVKLTPEEKALFNDVDPAGARTPPASAKPEAEHGAVDGFGGADYEEPFPAPVASKPAPQEPPSCECGVELNAENSFHGQHVRCPLRAAMAPTAPTQPTTPVAPLQPATSGRSCPACPHPEHAGRACGVKRGRGACRCEGAKPEPVAAPEALASSAAARVSAAITPEDVERGLDRFDAEMDRIDAELAERITTVTPTPAAHPLAGELRVSVTVDLGPTATRLVDWLTRR